MAAVGFARMGVVWRFLEEGAERGRSEAFPDREAAEAWLAAAWEDLADQGCDEVELVDDAGGSLYRMGLGPA